MMKTVIFDMDGVLIDSEVIYLKSLQKYLKTLDIEEDLQTLSCLVGMNAKDLTQKTTKILIICIIFQWRN